MARTGPHGPTVALVVSSRDDGWCESAATLLSRLTEWGFDAHVLFEGDAGEAPPFAVLPDEVLWQRVHPPPRSLRDRSRPGFQLSFLRTVLRHPLSAMRQLGFGTSAADRHLRAMLLTLQPRVVHVGSAASAVTWASPTALVGARLVVGLQADELAAGAERPAAWRTTWDIADALLVESNALAATAHRLGAPEKALGVVSPILEPTLAAHVPPSLDDGPLRILSKGPLSWTQGFEHSLHAIRLLADGDVPCSYRIVGSGDFIDALGFARHQLGVEELTEIVEVADSRQGADLSWAQVLVDSAVVPSSPRAVYSALARGIPVVTTQPPPGAEAAVLSVPRRDPRALADALGALARDPELFHRLAEAGQAFARTRQERDEGIRELARLYRLLPEASVRSRARRRSSATRS